MKLKLYYKNKKDIPEGFADHYTEQDDGRWMLQGDEIEDVTGLKSALSKERENRREAEAKVRAFVDAGITDPAAAAEALKKLEELSSLDPDKEAEKIAAEKFKSREKQLVTKHNEELALKVKESEGLTTQLNGLMIDAEATKAIAEHKGSVPLLLPIIKGMTRLSNENGKFTVEVLDANGNPQVGDAQGNMKTISQLVAEFKESETYGQAFQGAGASGSGAEEDITGLVGEGGKVAATDQAGLNANIEGIAEGKVTVTE